MTRLQRHARMFLLLAISLLPSVGLAAKREKTKDLESYRCPPTVKTSFESSGGWSARPKVAKLTGRSAQKRGASQVLTCKYGSAGELRRETPKGYTCEKEYVEKGFWCRRHGSRRDFRKR